MGRYFFMLLVLFAACQSICQSDTISHCAMACEHGGARMYKYNVTEGCICDLSQPDTGQQK